MRRRVELVDTSILDELLEVPGKADDPQRFKTELQQRGDDGIALHLPVAALVQVGMHVSRLDDGHHRRVCAERLSELIRKTIQYELPWTFAALEWNAELLRELIEPTPEHVLGLADSLAREHLEMGDLLIVHEFVRIRANLDPRAVELDLWTKDTVLAAVIASLR